MKWTDVEDRYLRIYYPKYGIEKCTKTLNRTANAIKSRTSRLGIRLNKEMLSKTYSISNKKEYKNDAKYEDQLPVAKNINTIEDFNQYNLRLIRSMSFRNIKQPK